MRSSRTSEISRTPRLRDASRRPSIDRSAPPTADARDEPSIAAALASMPPTTTRGPCRAPRPDRPRRSTRLPHISASDGSRRALPGASFLGDRNEAPTPTARSPSTATRMRPPSEISQARTRLRASPCRATPHRLPESCPAARTDGIGDPVAARSRRAPIRRALKRAPWPRTAEIVVAASPRATSESAADTGRRAGVGWAGDFVRTGGRMGERQKFTAAGK